MSDRLSDVACRCGCGQPAAVYARLIPESDEGSCEALRWTWMSVQAYREWVPVAEGHDEDGIPGYLSAEYVAQKITEFHSGQRAEVKP